MHDPVVIDANAILDKDLLHWLRNHYGEKILPIVAYVEAGIGFAYKGGATTDEEIASRLDGFNELLHLAGVVVEPARRGEMGWAVRSAITRMDVPWKQHSRDHLIAAHAMMAPRVLVTHDDNHFDRLCPRVMAPYEVIRKWP